MTDTAALTLAGRPINGDINVPYQRKRIEPAPIEDLVAAIDAVLALPAVESVRWVACTPSFNDGDPCYFSAYGVSVKLTGVDEDDTDYADGYLEAGWGLGYHLESNPEMANIITPELLSAGRDLETAIEGGAHDLDLQKYFGDPHEVVATTEGFQVEYYEGGY